MTYRAKIGFSLFLVGFAPCLTIIGISGYFLSSAFDRMAASSLESSLSSAKELIDDAQRKIVERMGFALDTRPQAPGHERLRIWLEENHFDLAFEVTNVDSIIVLSDSILLESGWRGEFAFGKPNQTHVTLGKHDFLITSRANSGGIIGCGILLSPEYAGRGKALAYDLSVTSSMKLFRAVTFNMLIVVTLAAVVVSAALAFIISSILSRQLVRPLEQLTRGAKIIGSGNLEHKVIVGGKNEFTKLAESFNKMSDEIRHNQEKLLQAERLAAWREVARRMAHEIRNPLTPITVQLFRIQQAMTKRQETSDELGAINSIKTQIDILEDLALQFSTFAREPELRPVRCSIRSLIGEARKPFESYENIEIVSNIAADIPPIDLDPGMMRRVFANLIKNSIEALSGKGVISIAAWSDQARILIVIKDNGPGFPPEKLMRIEQPYLTTKRTGTGLGIVIVKKIVEEHGGKMELYNEDGAVVRIMLPIGSSQAASGQGEDMSPESDGKPTI
jgi:signal transduction histidine kinase